MQEIPPYQTHKNLRVVTAASLFDGHDAAINLMRRIMQASGAEIIHLGHNRSVNEIVNCAIQEDAQAIAITSYQGGHLEYLKYMYDLLHENGAGHIKIFAGGGGTILPQEIDELHQYGIARVYSPDDGRELGLQGMINDVLQKSDYSTIPESFDYQIDSLTTINHQLIGQLITLAENYPNRKPELYEKLAQKNTEKVIPVLGITGTGGAGKSSLVDELVRRFLLGFPTEKVAIISIDPSKRKSGGALLGDRIRMNSIDNQRVYMRSLATRQANLAMSAHVKDAIQICKTAGFDLVIIETSGIGQSDTEITEHSDVSLYVMTSEYGAATQLEKIDMIDFADIIAINKFDKRGSEDALRDVRKQYRRNRNLFTIPDKELPVFGTIASQFNDSGTNVLFSEIIKKINQIVPNSALEKFEKPDSWNENQSIKNFVIPPDRNRYLAEIAENSDRYDAFVNQQVEIARQLYGLYKSITLFKTENQLTSNIGNQPRTTSFFPEPIQAKDAKSEEIKDKIQVLPELPEITSKTPDFLKVLIEKYQELLQKLDYECRQLLQCWSDTVERYSADVFEYQVRQKTIRIDLVTESLSGSRIPKITLPKYQDWGDILRWLMTENLAGEFPYAAGVFPLKRAGEDPARMFAGEGGAERTNKRFHYVSEGLPAKRLSTAFDSVTLYGEDPDHRPDIYGKIGNSGVSISTLDEAKKLYSGFDLVSPKTSVSMTINGPAPVILAFFMNAAIDQQCEIYIKNQGLEAEIQPKIKAFFAKSGIPQPQYSGDLPKTSDGLGLMLLGVTGDKILPKETYEKIKTDTISQVRGTVQADILKEDQAQNTCIFSTEFALRMMGDIQSYFINNNVKNFYSVSISGYHIAEAGANPISQLAFTLSNGFTFVEYYLARGMHIDDFAPNLSFFFSNGIDPEYAVIGRVARRIWAKALKYKYNANVRSQKLKYHIQTSGRSLHAQEINFNDIRTTLQALYAIYDNCNSLHTNAYDEAITTPTEESVRRALAIQLIINKELGLAKNENPLQGSFIIEELTDLVEQAVLSEFRRISERGGVLGAMERMYQRSKIQEESMHYEMLKHEGKIPIIGVNTFLDPHGSPTVVPQEVIRSTTEEKEEAISSLRTFQKQHQTLSSQALTQLQNIALSDGDTFAELMETVKTCSLGQISEALYKVGGQYRRNM